MLIYFASDIHGSERCWRKFIAAGEFYGADIAVMGGDITGKFLVPVIKGDRGITATVHGVRRTAKNEEQLVELRRLIADSGGYPLDVTQEEHDEYAADQSKLDAAFRREVLGRVRDWIELADQRLAGGRTRYFVSGGNDDYFEVDELLRGSATLDVPEGRIVEAGDGFEMFGVGYSNLTPWNCPRDVTEEELEERIEALASDLKDPGQAIFNIHVPPHGSGLDEAPRLTEDLEIVLDPLGEPEIAAVGSTAVRQAIERFQPLLSLHGHIHECAGVASLGSTTVVNPGSEYGEGLLRGALIEVDRARGVAEARLVTG